MIPLHEELKERRLAQGITLETIADKTKILIELLERMEDGDFSIVPNPYIRAFLREYALIISVDPDSVLAKFENKADTIRFLAPEKKTTESTETEKVEESLAEPSIEETEDRAANEDEPELSIENPLETVDKIVDETSDEDTEDAPEIAETVEENDDSSDTEVETEDSDQEPLDQLLKDEPQQDLFEEKDSDDSWKPGIEIPDAGEEKITEADDDDDAILPRHDILSAGPAMHPSESRKRLVIEEPDSGSNFLFFLFLGILIIAASVIVWMNRSGMF